MSKDPIEELTTLPGWDDLVTAGTVSPVKPEVLDRSRAAVREAATQDAVSATKRSVPRRRRTLIAGLAAAAASAAVVVAVLSTSHSPVASPEQQTPMQTPLPPSKSRPAGSEASCPEGYSLTNLANRAFAFDGTIQSITAIADATDVQLGYVSVTFAVNHWFRAGTSARVTVTMTASGHHSAPELTYRTGTRLLVSGGPRWGGKPLDDPVAWTKCGGFTQPYEAATATDWQSALK